MLFYIDNMSNRNARKKATLLKHQMKFMMMLSMMKLIRREGYESKKETEFINSAHYAAIAA